MADNVAITAGTGTNIATDDAGAGGHVQIIKLAISTDGSATVIPADAANGLDVDVTRLPALAAGTNNIGDVDVLTLPNVTLAAGTNTNEVVGDAAHDAVVAGNPVLVGGFASAAAPASVSADGDVVRAWYLRNGAHAAVITAAGALIGGDATNGLDVDVTRLPALVAGTANIGDVDVLTLPSIPAGTNNIGDVDVLTVPADPFGVNADAASATGSVSAKLRFIASTGIPVTSLPTLAAVTTLTTLTGGGVAHDAADSGNPHKVGARAVSSLASATLVAAADRADNVSDLDGRVITVPYCPNGDILVERLSDTGGTSSASTVFGATASARNCITTISVANVSATAGFIDFRDGTAGTILFTLPIPAGGGAVISFPVPLRQTTANTALAYDVSAALTTVYISLIGFKSKA